MKFGGCSFRSLPVLVDLWQSKASLQIIHHTCMEPLVDEVVSASSTRSVPVLVRGLCSSSCGLVPLELGFSWEEELSSPGPADLEPLRRKRLLLGSGSKLPSEGFPSAVGSLAGRLSFWTDWEVWLWPTAGGAKSCIATGEPEASAA